MDNWWKVSKAGSTEIRPIFVVRWPAPLPTDAGEYVRISAFDYQAALRHREEANSRIAELEAEVARLGGKLHDSFRQIRDAHDTLMQIDPSSGLVPAYDVHQVAGTFSLSADYARYVRGFAARLKGAGVLVPPNETHRYERQCLSVTCDLSMEVMRAIASYSEDAEPPLPPAAIRGGDGRPK